MGGRQKRKVFFIFFKFFLGVREGGGCLQRNTTNTCALIHIVTLATVQFY